MARTKKEVNYEVGNLIVESMVREIVAKDKTFSHITVGQIKIINIEGKKRKVPIVIHGMKEPLNLLVDFKYVLYVYADTFHDISQTKQFVHVYRALASTSDEFDGSIKRKDVSDYSEIISKFGIFWQYEDDDCLDKKLGTINKNKKEEEGEKKECLDSLFDVTEKEQLVL